MVDPLFIGVGLVVRLADTFCDHLSVTLLVASVLAVCALHACGVLEEISTQGTAHDVVELLGDKLVTLLFVDLFLFLAHGTLSVETDIEGAAIFQLFGCTDC